MYLQNKCRFEYFILVVNAIIKSAKQGNYRFCAPWFNILGTISKKKLHTQTNREAYGTTLNFLNLLCIYIQDSY